MKISKKLVTLLFSILLIAILTACSSGSEDEGTTTETDDSEGLEKLEVSIGWQPHGGPSAVQAIHMKENNLIEKHAKNLGIDLTIDWRTYQSGAPMLTELMARELDIGLEGSTPVIRAIAEKQDLDVLSLGEGRFSFVLITREGSGIRNFEDLKGKKLGVILGTDNEFAFRDMIHATLGSNDPSEFDITLVNMSTQAQAASVPSGVDAAVTTYPNYVKAHLKDESVVAVANSHGVSEEYYEGEAGSGEGHQIPTVNESNLPEGFYLHRAFWVGQDKLVKEEPDLIKAFLLAQQESLLELSETSTEELAELVSDEQYWGIPASYGANIIEADVMFLRKWIWITEGELDALESLTKSLSIANPDSEVPTKEDIVENLKQASNILKEVYEESNYPDEEEFHNDEAIDNRGFPSWEIENWSY